MKERLLYLQISESVMERLREQIVEILRESGAKCGILTDRSGHILIRKGFTLIREIENLCALIAASRATTREIARILGQDKISVIFHQGAGDQIHSIDVGDHAILALLCDDRAELARLQSVVSQKVPVIAELLASALAEAATTVTKIENLTAEADKAFDMLFIDAGEAPRQGFGA